MRFHFSLMLIGITGWTLSTHCEPSSTGPMFCV